jgi:hypothetical protein
LANMLGRGLLAHKKGESGWHLQVILFFQCSPGGLVALGALVVIVVAVRHGGQYPAVFTGHVFFLSRILSARS